MFVCVCQRVAHEILRDEEKKENFSCCCRESRLRGERERKKIKMEGGNDVLFNFSLGKKKSGKRL